MFKTKRKAAFLLILILILTGCSSQQSQNDLVKTAVLEQADAEFQSNVVEQADLASPSLVVEQTDTDSQIPSSEQAEPSAEESHAEDTSYDFTICFAGDINLDESWGTTQYMDAQPNGIYDCISKEMIDTMQAADIMCLNNEFTYSTGGAPMEGKAYTFRAKPERVEILHQLGVDAVTLANNHVYDYGREALLDTFSVLEEADIPYVGAGRTLQEAMKPVYLEVDGKTVALVAASRAEKNKMTPQADDENPGILRCYDTELFLQVIKEAKENADFCIAFVHWGTEYSYDLEQVQLSTGKEYLDAGADAVIGAHSHCLQGMEYYDGKPIIYSLGNYWFNGKTLDTMLVQLNFSGDDTETQLTVQVIPAVQAEYKTTYASEESEQRRIYDFLESISVNVDILDDGTVVESEL
ncbi:MAG: CapA family protein [Lachnospiraceae bacterium]|nr:CapA family protein [Lachnospiraceae bacterium]